MAKGHFIWFDLFTPDLAKSQAFYTDLLDWNVHVADMGEMGEYPMFQAGERGLGGMMPAPEGAPPHWLAYIEVDDVDAAVAKAKELGGSVIREAMDMPTVGRWAVLADPQGAVFAPFKGEESMPANDNQPGLGEFCWHELMSTDIDAALTFYGEVLGWTKGQSMDIPGGTYQMFDAGEKTIGGAMNLDDEMKQAGARPSWIHYTVVEDVTASVENAKKLGGTLLHGPVPVPGGEAAMFADPTGAVFALWAGEAQN